jgi:hypothetical protein
MGKSFCGLCNAQCQKWQLSANYGSYVAPWVLAWISESRQVLVFYQNCRLDNDGTFLG